jgi:uncharacterized protein YcaQ
MTPKVPAGPMKISLQTARRFVLGDQGLWPGRRWQGLQGTEQAMIACEHLQLDPLDVGARAHDFILHSRVSGYQKKHYDRLVYEQKKFFEWGGWLATRPISEWPHWRALMERARKRQPKSTAALLRAEKEVLAALKSDGAKMNRHFSGEKLVGHYRARKTTALALYRLWMRGEVVTSGRERFERVYDLSERFVPVEFRFVSPEREADLFMLRKIVAFNGLTRFTQQVPYWNPAKKGGKEKLKLMNELIENKVISPVLIEGFKETYYVLSEKIPLLEILEKGQVPKAWKPLAETTSDEAVFLSPLDNVSARGRATKFFDLEYVWEVYKPESKRRWGYYTLPILFADRLVGRIEPILDRKTGEMSIKGLWLDDNNLEKDEVFAAALTAGIANLANLYEAKSIRAKDVKSIRLRKAIEKLKV